MILTQTHNGERSGESVSMKKEMEREDLKN